SMSAAPTTKCCTKCGETRPLDEFARDRGRRDGRTPNCRLSRRTAYRERSRRYAAQTAKVAPTAKRAPRCERTLPASARAHIRTRADGVHDTCRDCHTERRRAWREKNAEYVRESRRSPAGRAAD